MQQINFRKFLSLVLFSALSSSIFTQVDHWETVVYASDEWKYQEGNMAFPNDWYLPNFDDSAWLSGNGGFGYSDGDDETILPQTLAVALRKEFEITDISKIEAFILCADYDDGFVAYLNGVEFARANLGEIGIPPDFNEGTPTDHEANLYQGEQPEYFFNPNVEDFLTNGTNVLAIQVNNVNFFSSDLSANFFLSFGINDTSIEYGTPPNWFEAPLEFITSDLPIFVINTNGQNIVNEPRIAADLGIIHNGFGETNNISDPFNEYDGQISIEIRGASSQGFPKNSFSFETQNADSTNNNVSLLEMPEENDWILYAPYSDKTLMRNMLTYQYARNMGRYAPRTQPIELVIDGDYRGVYVLVERIKRDANRVDIAKLTPEDIEGDELTGGYLMQIDRDAQGIYDGWYSSHAPNNFFAFDDPDWDEIQPAQAEYIRNYMDGFENAMAAGNFSDSYDNLIDDDSFIDYVLANEIPKHIDAYRLSFFLYKMKDSNGGKIHFGPIWDINLGYGNFDYGCDNSPSGWSYNWGGFSGPNCAPVTFWVPKIANIPAVQDKMKCRWEELRENVLATNTLHNYIDSMALVMQTAQARNFQRWPVLGEYVWPNDFVGNTYQSEINNLKSWVTIRLNWMDNNMEGECIIDDVLSLNTDFNLQVFPNPFQNEVRFLVKNSNFQKGEIRVLDVLGRTVLEKDIIGNEPLVLETGGLENGIYFYEFRVEGQLVRNSSIVKLP